MIVELDILVEFFSNQKFYLFNFLTLPSDIISFSAILKSLILILKNQCSNIFSGTESDMLVHLLLIHF